MGYYYENTSAKSFKTTTSDRLVVMMTEITTITIAVDSNNMPAEQDVVTSNHVL